MDLVVTLCGFVGRSANEVKFSLPIAVAAYLNVSLNPYLYLFLFIWVMSTFVNIHFFL